MKTSRKSTRKPSRKAKMGMVRQDEPAGRGRRWWKNLYPKFFSLLETANIKVILPTSAIRPYSLLNGEKIRVWHDRNSLSCDSIEDKEGLIKTGNFIKKIISDLWTTDKIDISNYGRRSCFTFCFIWMVWFSSSYLYLHMLLLNQTYGRKMKIH